jgi:adenylylsulfate kinase
MREQITGGKPTQPVDSGFILWLTGMSGAGKSTLAQALRAQLESHHRPVQILDGDEVRANLSRGLGFSREDREENVRRIGYVAQLLARHRVAVIVAAISPYRTSRDEVRGLAAEAGLPFVEVHVQASMDTLVRRDVKGLYKKALAGEIPQFTGISSPYETPEAPEVVVCTDTGTVDGERDRILEALLARGLLARLPSKMTGHSGGASMRTHQDFSRVRWELLSRGDELASYEDAKRFAAVAHCDVFSIYGLSIDELWERKIRISCRTLVESTKDEWCHRIIEEQSHVLKQYRAEATGEILVFDPFCGSANLLLHAGRFFGRSRCLGWEKSAVVYENSVHAQGTLGIARTECRIELRSFEELSVPGFASLRPNMSNVVIIDPPFGDALDDTTGLDLTKTKPPVASIIERWLEFTKEARTLFLVKSHLVLNPASLEPLRAVADLRHVGQCSLTCVGGNLQE